jgi:hypothetical protein
MANELIHADQSGTEIVVEEDGTIRVKSGGEIVLEAGATLEVDGVEVDSESLAVEGLTASADELNVLDGATAGASVASKAVVLDADKATDVIGLSAGAAAAAVALRFGASATEGLEVRVIDEVVTLTNDVATDLTEDIPIGAVILSAQANLDTAVVGDASGDNLLAKVGVGVAADPDKYGKTSVLTQNAKVDTLPDWAVLSGAEDIQLFACKTDGSACTEKFVGGESVRVRIVYIACNSLDNAA